MAGGLKSIVSLDLSRLSSRRRRSTRKLRRSPRRTGPQPLEPRLLLAGDPIAHWLAQDLNANFDDGAIVTGWTDSMNQIVAATSDDGAPQLIRGAVGGRSVVRFDAADGSDAMRVAFGENPLSSAGDFTVAVVFSTTATDLRAGQQWYEHTGLLDSSNLGLTTDWGISLNDQGQVAAGVGAGFGRTSATVYSSSSGLNDGNAHVLVLSREGTQISLYVDNEAADKRDDANSNAIARTLDLTLGDIQSGGGPFSGDIAEVRIYDAAMNSSEASGLHDEIIAYYNNSAPNAVDDRYELEEDPLLVVIPPNQGVLANDSDADSDPLTAVLVETTENGNLTLQPNGSFIYAPKTNFFGIDTFTYTANDFRPSAAATVTIEVTPKYDPAVTVEDSYKSLSGQILSVDAASGVLTNDENPDQVNLTAVLDSDVKDGALTLNGNGSFEYDPQGFTGTTSFAYKIDDGTGTSAAAAVTLVVNTPPVANDDQYDVSEDVPFSADAALGVLANDDDAEDDAVTATLIGEPTHGTLEFREDGSFSYVPLLDYFGDDAFTYKLNDWTDESRVASVGLRVISVNDAPSAKDDIYFAAAGESITATREAGVLANDTDVDSAELTAQLVSTASNGTVALDSSGSFSYEPNAGFTGVDSFTYKANDSDQESSEVTVNLFVGQSPIRISEILAANATSIPTRTRETIDDSFRGDEIRKDWIELENVTDTPIDIGGFHVTDNDDNVRKWRIPEGTTISESGRLLLFASRANITDPALDEQGAMHTNFTLNVEGEYLAITSPGGTVLHEFDSFPRQVPNVSYGIDANGELGFLQEATPGEPNAATYPGVVDDPTFSVGHGFYSEAFQVEIQTTTPEAEIRFTVDGSAPTPTNGQIYDAPVNITTTTTLRATAFLDGLLASRATTQTYLFINDVIQQDNSPEGYPEMFGLGPPDNHPWAPRPADYEMDPEITQSPKYRDLMDDALLAIPSISIVTDVDHLFDTETGIYQNTDNHGVEWERPASIELIMPDGSTGFQIDAGLRIQGGASREPWKSPKHGFRLKFKGIYGHEKLRYDWFGGDAADEFDEIVLRAGANQAYTHHNNFLGDNRGRAQYVRDQWANDTYRAMGNPAPHTDYAHVYVNGLYWGLYNPKERPTNGFMESYFGGDKDSYDTLNAGQLLDGNTDAWKLLNSRDFRALDDDETYQQFTELLDIDAFIDYMLMNHYGGNLDWDSHNWYAAYSREPGGKFVFIPWDSEFMFISPNDNVTRRAEAAPGRTLRNLLKNDEFTMQMADRIQKHFFNDGLLTPSSVIERWEVRSSQVEQAIIGESARWGDFRRDVDRQGIAGPFELLERDVQWMAERERLLNEYFPERTAIVVEQYRRFDVFPSIDAPVFNQRGGNVETSFDVELSATDGTIYYTTDGSDPRLPRGELNPHAVEYTGTFRLTEPTLVRTRALSGDEWSALDEASFFVGLVPASDATLRISEIYYNPADPTQEEIDAGHDNNDDFEFIELVNISNQRIDISQVRFERTPDGQDQQGLDFQFSSGAISYLEPGERILVVEDTEAFVARYGDGLPIAGQWSGRLSNNQEQLTLKVGDNLIHQFTYDDAWYPDTDGGGLSLEIIDATNADLAGWGQAARWQPSSSVGGSPGTAGAAVPGDSNHDGVFDSSDLVLVFQGGEYEDEIPDNSTFEEGDWDGDNDFTTSDLVFAFRAGTFVRAASSVDLNRLADEVFARHLIFRADDQHEHRLAAEFERERDAADEIFGHLNADHDDDRLNRILDSLT